MKKRLDLAIAEARVIPSVVAGMDERRRNEAVSGVARSAWEAASALIEQSGSTVHVEEQLPGLRSGGSR